MREPDDDPWARPRHEEPTSTPGARRRQPDDPGPLLPVEPSATLDTHEELEGGDETPLSEHLLRPGILGAVLLLAGAAGLVLLLVHPWAPSPPPSAPAPSPTASALDVRVVSTGSTGTVLPGQETGWGAARLEMRVDMVTGGSGRVLGITGPGVAEPTAAGPLLEPGTSSITRAGAVFRCPQTVGAAGSDFGLAVQVVVDGRSTQITAPLAEADGPAWVALVSQACGRHQAMATSRPGPTPTPSVPSDQPEVLLSPIGSEGTFEVTGGSGLGAASITVRADLVLGTGGQVVGVVGPGVVRSESHGPDLAPGSSSLVTVGATVRCAEAVPTDPASFAVAMDVDLGGTTTRLVRPLPRREGRLWYDLLRQSCTASP